MSFHIMWHNSKTKQFENCIESFTLDPWSIFTILEFLPTTNISPSQYVKNSLQTYSSAVSLKISGLLSGTE